MRLNKSRVVLASLIGLFALIVAACGNTNTSQNVHGNLGAYKYVTPAKGGTIVYGDWQAPDGVNPIDGIIGASLSNVEVTNASSDGCLLQLPDLSLKEDGWRPSQCTEVPTVANKGESVDATTTTFHLDPKAKWSNGDQITADDYLFGYAFIEDPNIGGAFSPYDKAKLTRVDTFTLRVDWGQPYAPYRIGIAGIPPVHTGSSQGAWDGTKTGCTTVSADNIANNQMPCYSSTAAQKLISTDAFNQTPVVNGPYVVQSFKAGDSVVFVPNTNYYSRFFHVPTVDKLIFRVAGSKDALIQAYIAGEYDQTYDYTVPDLAKFAGVNSQEIYVTPEFSYEHLEFNQRNAAPHAKDNGGKSIFADTNVRKAFIEGWDRCNAIQTILGRDCNDPGIKTNEVTVPLDPAYDPNAAFPGYNPTDAASILEAAGFKKDAAGVRTYPGTTKEVTINVITRGPNAVRTSFLQLMQSNWQKNLSIKVTFENDPLIFKPWDSNGSLYRGTYDVALFAFNLNGDCDQLTSNVQADQIPTATAKTGQNYTGINNPTIDQLLLKQRGDVNFDSRVATCKQLYAEVANNFYFEPLYIRANISTAKTTLQNYSPHPAQVGDWWNVGDWGTTAKAK